MRFVILLPRLGGKSLTLDLRQSAALVHGDVVGFVALDLVLRIIFRAVMYIALEVYVARMFPDDNAFNVTGFGVPSDMVPDRELLYHPASLMSRPAN
jgi:hypothetical protein